MSRENSMIRYTDSLDGIGPEKLVGFFVGWPNPPSSVTHLEMLKGSAVVLLAIDDASGDVVGFINAISDGVLSAFIPLLEVLPAYRRRGIGSELARRMLDRLGDLYMVDLLCDEGLIPFYARLGLTRLQGMGARNYARQSGRAAAPVGPSAPDGP